MPALIIPTDKLDYDSQKLLDKVINNLDTGEEIGLCTHPAGHCFGSDGGSGIPSNLKVAPGRGETIEVWRLDKNKTKIQSKWMAERCQYCLRLYVNQEITE